MQEFIQENIGRIIFIAVAVIVLIPSIWCRVRGSHIEKMKDICQHLANFHAGKNHAQNLVETLAFQSSFHIPTAETAPLLCQQVFLVLLERHELTLEPRDHLYCFTGCAQWKRVGQILHYWWDATKSGVSLEDSITKLQQVRYSIAQLAPSDCRSVLLAYVSFIEGTLLLKSHGKNPRKERLEELIRAFGKACSWPDLQIRSMDHVADARKFVEADLSAEEKLKVTA